MYLSTNINSFDMITHITSTKKTEEREALETLYKRVKDYRDKRTNEDLNQILEELINHHPQDWLLTLEIVELSKLKNLPIHDKSLEHLQKVKENRPEVAHLITNGLNLL